MLSPCTTLQNITDPSPRQMTRRHKPAFHLKSVDFKTDDVYNNLPVAYARVKN